MARALRYVALLRGINVGRHNRIGMAPLRAALEEAGFDDVVTLLQSGNVVLTSDVSATSLESSIESVIRAEFSMDVAVVVRTAAQVAAVAKHEPFPDVSIDPSKLLVAFAKTNKPLGSTLEDLDPSSYAPDRLSVRGREIYVWYPNGLRAATLTPAMLDRGIPGRVTVTARNWNTVTKLAALSSTAP